MFHLHGIYAPIPNPFFHDEIAYDKLAENMNFWLGSKLSENCRLGLKREFVVLHPEEKRRLISSVCELAGGRKRLLRDRCESTQETVALNRYPRSRSRGGFSL
jgi:4-hydroxy-2-oxoglutarate aldolase